MDCLRCHGLMVMDRVIAVDDKDLESVIWRCVCCGNIVDPVILANKKKQHVDLVGATR